jgi:probable HAF family extracellular repeat protein
MPRAWKAERSGRGEIDQGPVSDNLPAAYSRDGAGQSIDIQLILLFTRWHILSQQGNVAVNNVSDFRALQVNSILLAFVSLTCLVHLAPNASASPMNSGYQVTDVGVYPGPYSGVTWLGSSPSGVVMGTLGLQDGQPQVPAQPVAWINGQVTTLGPPSVGYPYAVNASGQIVGEFAKYNYSTGSTGNSNYFLYSAGTFTDLGTFGSTDARAIRISDNGLIAAMVVAPDGTSSVVVDSSGRLVRIPSAAPGAYMLPTAINNAGQVVGQFSSPSGNGQGFFYSAGKTIVLGALQGSSSNNSNWPSALSSNGIVVGQAYATNSLPGQAPGYIYQNGVMSRIPQYQGNEFIPISVNSQGMVLGSAPIGVNSFKSFQQLLYNSSTGVFTPLNDLLPAGMPWTVNYGISIDDQGQILARATENGAEHLVELSPVSPGDGRPVPEPGTFLIFGLIACAAVARRRCFGRRG